MPDYHLLAASGLHFSTAEQALNHIGTTLLTAGVVRQSYPAALLARESLHPTGISLQEHAIAIPHCDVTHAREPAIYLIRPTHPVPFISAEGEEEIAASLIFALVVTNPAQQIPLLRSLFSYLQQPESVTALLQTPAPSLADFLSRGLQLEKQQA